MAGKGKGKAPPKGPGGGQRMMRVRVKTAAKRSTSSARWLERQLNDPYVVAAKREGFRSRAAYKLLEMDDKYRILKPGQRVVDLGAAPGGWSQIAADRVKSIDGRGQVVAIDYLGMEPLPGVEIEERALRGHAAGDYEVVADEPLNFGFDVSCIHRVPPCGFRVLGFRFQVSGVVPQYLGSSPPDA